MARRAKLTNGAYMSLLEQAAPVASCRANPSADLFPIIGIKCARGTGSFFDAMTLLLRSCTDQNSISQAKHVLNY